MMFQGSLNNLLSLATSFACATAFHVAPPHTQFGLQAPAIAVPIVTSAPSHDVVSARQAGQSNPICGWINGNGASAVSCGIDFYCATQQSFVGCCATSSCPGIVTTCYDMLGKDICNAACQRRVGNLVCGSTLPYCATYQYEGSSVGYGCAAAAGFKVTVALSVTASDGGSLTMPTTSSTATSSSTIALATPTIIAEPVKSDGIGAGAIAGIVIGSIVTFLLAAMFIFWIITSHRKHRQQQEQANYQLSVQGVDSPHGNGYGPSQRSSTPGYFGYFKADEPQDSPTLNQASPTRTSAYGSDFSPTLRDSHAPGYSGPTIPEMDSGGYGRVRGGR